MRGFARIAEAIQSQRGYLFPWTPVFIAIGIGVYFYLRVEPEIWHLTLCGLVATGAICMARVVREGFAPLLLAISFILLGIVLAAYRAHYVAGPVLQFRFYGAVEGTVVGLDRSSSDKLRVTLSDVVLERVPADRTPHFVRVSLHGEQGFVDPSPGMRIVLTAHLSPPSGPTEPGGFDFQRHAWFKGIGAVGYTRIPALSVDPPSGVFSLFGLRMNMSRHIRSFMESEVGGFAAAVTTGDRSNIHDETTRALRASNLAHLLAISGLHLGLLAGFVFAVIRIGLALIPPVVQRVPAKKVAAGVALVAAAGYLALSGGNVATQRAFVMAAVALVAVLLDRRAFSLRAVAMAAIIVMVMRPEAILGPGFQMSFAATTALVAVFGFFRDYHGPKIPRWATPILGVFISSLVAGLATAPIAAAHFNVVSHYGLPANLLAVPVMGLVVVPAAVLSLCLSPVGGEWIGLRIMSLGLEWILSVAYFFAERPGARGFVPSPPDLVLPLFSLGMLWLILWRSRARAIGVIVAVGALVLWVRTDRPDVLISDTGGLVGVMTDSGRALSKARGQGFVALNWLENDGDPADQAVAAERLAMEVEAEFVVDFADGRLIHVQGAKASTTFSDCNAKDIVVFTHQQPVGLPCEVMSPQTLQNSGAVAFRLKDGRLEKTTAREISGLRLWNRYGADQ